MSVEEEKRKRINELINDFEIQFGQMTRGEKAVFENGYLKGMLDERGVKFPLADKNRK